MKLVIAIFQPDVLNQVREALIAADITRITVSRCTGRGKGDQNGYIYRGQAVAPTLMPKVRIDIACNDEYVDTAVKTILKAAKHGEKGEAGDGKIFVVPLEKVYRIRTEEEGSDAI